MVETMRWEQGSLVLLDQTLLPQKIEWITCVDYKRVKVAIERLEVRGAPAIGAAAAFAMVLGAREVADKPDFLGALDVVRADLITARPTAVNLAWAAKSAVCVGCAPERRGQVPCGDYQGAGGEGRADLCGRYYHE